MMIVPGFIRNGTLCVILLSFVSFSRLVTVFRGILALTIPMLHNKSLDVRIYLAYGGKRKKYPDKTKGKTKTGRANLRKIIGSISTLYRFSTITP